MSEADPASRDPVRVLVVVGALGRGGGERQALFAARALQSAGLGVTVFVAQPPLHLLEDGVAAGLDVLVPVAREFWTTQLLRLREAIDRLRPSVIVSFMTSASARVLAVRQISPAARAALWVTSERGNVELSHLPRAPFNTALRLAALRRADAVVVNAASLGANVMSYAGDLGDRISVIPNLISPFRVDAEAARAEVTRLLGRRLTFPGLVALGSCQWARNYELLIRALSLVTIKHPGLHLTIVGRTSGRDCGPPATRLARMIEARGLGRNVTMIGEVRDARTLLPAFDAFVLTSKLEGSSNGLVEAVIAGMPIASTPVGDAPEVLAGAGALARGWTPAAMAEAILGVLDDPGAWRLRAAERARTLMRERSSDAIGQRWVSVIDDAQHGKEKPPSC